MPHSSTTTVIRADWSAYWAWFRSGSISIAIGLILGVVVTIVTWGANPVIGFVLLAAAVIIAIVLGGVALYIARARVELLPDELVYHRLLPSIRIPVTSQTRGVLAKRLEYSGPGRTPLSLLIQNGTKGRRLRLSGGFFSRESLKRIAKHAGAIDRSKSLLLTADVERLAPGLLPVTERHPVAVAVIATLGIFALVIVGVIIAVALSGRFTD